MSQKENIYWTRLTMIGLTLLIVLNTLLVGFFDFNQHLQTTEHVPVIIEWIVYMCIEFMVGALLTFIFLIVLNSKKIVNAVFGYIKDSWSKGFYS